ncbi:MAG: adenine methyltransferase [Mesorhizobium sp.]|uniref:DNA N-6-adenine-methyltransferase n=1 Tax=Mesorhizobium sp. TaxID=1871066 RepID=UPI00121323DD|nr:DNA N-6-adenine-methyltransferase [Mesorhizobium sp.]TIT32634.1 MAG: adenine methyltransferase [Mesorhizobium sp.]
MSRDFNTASATQTKDEWLTPPAVIAALGCFDLDPCSPIVRPWDTATTHFDINADGMKQPWFGRVWLNPPYGDQTFNWLAKLAAHRNGIALVFARTETKGFHREVWQKADALLFFEGRLKFFHVTGEAGGAANAPSVLVAYGEENAAALKSACERGLLRGQFIRLRGDA